jgi:hypothetical protein
MPSPTDHPDDPMTSSAFILGGSLILILAAAWWVLRA